MASKFEVILTGSLDNKITTDNIQNQIKNIEKSLSMQIDTKINTNSIKSAKGSVSDLGDAAKNSKAHVQGLSDQLGKFAQWQIIGDIIHGAMNATKDMVTQVIELDSSLVELSKVSNMTEVEMSNFTQEAYNLGEQVARTRYRSNKCSNRIF